MLILPLPEEPKKDEKSIDLAFTLGIIALCFLGIGVIIASVLPVNSLDRETADQSLLIIFMIIALFQAVPLAIEADRKITQEKKLQEDSCISIVIKKDPIQNEEEKD